MIDPSSEPSGREPFWLVWALLAAVLTLHVFANSLHISDAVFYIDESSTYRWSNLPFLNIADTTGRIHGQPPLYYWVAHVVLELGDSRLALRSLSFSFVAGMLIFTMLGLRELSIWSRVVLCVLLTLSSFSLYASINFRPYSMAMFFVLLSSVMLYRTLKPTRGWRPALAYGAAALGLQYSLTLNCWVFGCQMSAVVAVFATLARREGLRVAVDTHGKLIAVCLVLCVSYALFLAWLVLGSEGYLPSGEFLDRGSYWLQLKHNFGAWFIPSFLNPKGLSRMLVVTFGPPLFIAGVYYSYRRYLGSAIYLLAIFFGQFVFSAYIMYLSLHFFDYRYLTSSFVAYALLAALGYEFFAARRWSNTMTSAVALLMLLIVIPSAYQAFSEAQAAAPIKNPFREIIDPEKCPDLKNLVFCSSAWNCNPAAYEFRHSDTVLSEVTDLSIEHARAAKSDSQCILFFERFGSLISPEEKAALEFLDGNNDFMKRSIDLRQRYPGAVENPMFPEKLHVYRPSAPDLASRP